MTHDTHKPHVLPLSVYLFVGSTLLVLTVVTVWVASFDLGSANLIVAMIIAAVKGTLVLLYFMHLRYDNKLYAVVFATAIFFLAVFIIITMFDTMRRDDIYKSRGLQVNDSAVIYDNAKVTSLADSVAIGTDSSAVKTALDSASTSKATGH